MRILVVCMLAAVACSRRSAAPEPVTPPPREQPRPAQRQAEPVRRPMTGSYRFTAVNKSKVPAEFPPGSGTRLEAGSLELRADNRFSMRFDARPAGAAEARTSGEDGSYRMSRDTLYFTVDGRESQPAVIFRFARTSTGLRLIDTKGNAWIYVRQ
jgi:hypothetical protein